MYISYMILIHIDSKMFPLSILYNLLLFVFYIIKLS